MGWFAVQSCHVIAPCLTMLCPDVLWRCVVLQPPAKGGGLSLAPPREDKADSDRGFLEVINVTIVDTLIEGNVAVEGGGIWSAWPMHVVNTTVRHNLAHKAVSTANQSATLSTDCLSLTLFLLLLIE